MSATTTEPARNLLFDTSAQQEENQQQEQHLGLEQQEVRVPTSSADIHGLVHSATFSLPRDLADLIISTPPEPITPIDEPSVEEAKLRLAERFFLRRSRRFIGPSRRVAPLPERSRIHSLMSSLKDSVKSTLANSLPKTRTLTQMTNTLVSTLKSQRLPECLRYLGLATCRSSPGCCPETGVKRKRDHEDADDESSDFQFAKPKTYECGYCNASYLHVSRYLKHVRRHTAILRCEGCNRSFGSLISKRRHQLQCHKRAIL